MKQLCSHWTDFHEIWYLSIFRKSIEKIQVWLKSDNNNGYFTWVPIYIFIVSTSILFRIRNVSDNSCRENQNTHYLFNSFFFKSYSLWDNVEKFYRVWQPQMTIWRMNIECRITKAIHTHTQYVIFIAFLLQQLIVRTRLNLTYTYIACLVYYTRDYKYFYARIWEQNSIIFPVNGNCREPNTLCNMHAMKIYLLIYFFLCLHWEMCEKVTLVLK